jgi:hypothetical protein
MFVPQYVRKDYGHAATRSSDFWIVFAYTGNYIDQTRLSTHTCRMTDTSYSGRGNLTLAVREHEASSSFARWNACDRRRAAVYVAGHIVIGRHIGLADVSGWIGCLRHPTSGVCCWNGQWRYTGGWGQDWKRTMFFVAGFAGEVAWAEKGAVICVDDLLEDPRLISDSDWSGIDIDLVGTVPADFCRALYRAVDLLSGSLRPALVYETRALIAYARAQGGWPPLQASLQQRR